MIARFCLFLALAAVAVTGMGSAAAQAPRYAALVIEYPSGRVLHAENPDALVHPASLTKMMTLYMLFEAIQNRRLSFGAQMWVSAHAAAQSPTKLGLRAGDTISVEDAALGLITKSANDASVVIAENLAGSHARFAQLMTQRARRLGMSRSHFENANGLPDPDQITTARDMATLGRALMRDFPQYYPMFSTKAFSYRGQVHGNHNKLLYGYAGTDGIKTGYTRASGFNLVASVRRGNDRVIGVVIGGMSGAWRDRRMMTLLDSAFRRLDGDDDSPAPMVAAAPQPRVPVRVQPVVHRPPALAGWAPSIRLPEPGPAALKGGAVPRGWAIQIGAFADVRTAQSHAVTAQRVAGLRVGSAFVVPVPKKRNLFRARIGGLSEAQARAACKVLSSKKQSCHPLPPGQAAG